ncbi:MAG: carbohydrate ABC transporter permease [Anaerolineae bacterium]|nr:carbohydrate ABC transporter permease [Anaerolineae bacterium]
MPDLARKMTTSTARLNKRLKPIGVNLALILVCGLMLFPVFSTLVLSFKQQEDVRRQPPLLFPCDTPTSNFDLGACRFFTEGYQRVFLPQPDANAMLGIKLTGRIFSTYLPNTILYASVTALLVTIISAMSAYVYSRYRFRGRRALMVGLLVLAGVPILTMLLAMQQMGNAIRRAIPGYEERLFMIVVYIGFELPFAIWVVKGFFDTIPRELEEAALIDGCSRFWRFGAGSGSARHARPHLHLFAGLCKRMERICGELFADEQTKFARGDVWRVRFHRPIAFFV